MKRLYISIPLVAIISLLAFLGFSFKKTYKETNSTLVFKESKHSQEGKAVYQQKKDRITVVLDNYFDRAIKNGDIIGAGVSIVQGDSILLSNGYGKRHIDSDQQIDGETAFRLGSLSKGFAGVLSASIKNDGLINWNDNIKKYLPEFELGGNHIAKITIAHILSHSSGTPYHSYTDLLESGMALEKIAPRFKDVVPISEPGNLYSYQNALFAFSGTIIEKATRGKFGNTMDKKLFKPLGMDHATTNHDDFISNENIAYPHQKTNHSWRSLQLTDKYDNAIAAGGVNASSLDMAKWMRFLLGHNPEVLDQAALQDVFKPQVDIKGKRKYYQRWKGHQSSFYGFGWRIHTFKNSETDKESTIIHHGGSVNDYRNEIAIFPEDDLGICVLFNSNTHLASTVIPELHDLVKQQLKHKSENR